LAGVLVWVAAGGWLGILEGAIDEYTGRILVAAVVGPLGGAVGWLLSDILRNTRRSTARSLLAGLVAGMVATLPGAVSVGLPWSVLVGVIAGGLAAVIYSARGAEGGLAARWGATLLVAAAVGFLAPPVSGDTVGLIFTARAAVLTAPVLVFFAVAGFAVAVSAPVWVMVRRHAARERIPARIVVDE
jgi:ammonia channel protein AmtB